MAWLKSFLQILAGMIIRSTDDVQPIHDRAEKLTKWWLDIVPKALLAAGLVVAATKADSPALSLLAAVTTAAFFTYAMVPINRYELRLPEGVASAKTTKLLSTIWTFCVTIALTLWMMQAFGGLVSLLPALKEAVR
jgi:hypothetical protein